MTQSSRPQAGNKNPVFGNPAYIDAGPWSRDEWAEKVKAENTGDSSTVGQRTRLRGVMPTNDNLLIVTNPAGASIVVGTGVGIATGTFLFNTAAVTFTPNTPGIASRTDKVVMVENNTNVAYAGVPSGVILDFPTDLTDYGGATSVPPYAARLAILRGDAATGAATALIQTADYWMIELARFNITNVPAVNTLTDYREFANIETIVGVHSDDEATIKDALIMGTEVNDDVGAAGLGVGLRARLENAAGDVEDAGQTAFRWTDAANGSEDARYELRLSAGNVLNLSAVINAPDASSVDGNARGVGAVDLQQNRQVVTEVASGDYALLAAGVENTASGDYSGVAAGTENVASGAGSFVAGGFLNIASGDYAHAEGYDNEASGEASHAEGRKNVASEDYAHAEGYQTAASAVYSHAEGINTVASFGGAHAEGNATMASQSAAHAEGANTVASGFTSHAEGSATIASGAVAHAEGTGTIASGTAAHAEGYQTTASGDFSSAGGVHSGAGKHAQFSRACNRFAANGDAQYSDYPLLRVVTHSNANWYSLYLDLSAVNPGIPVGTDEVMTFDCLLVGTTQGCAKSFAFRIVGIVKNDGGTTSLLASTVTKIYDTDDTDFDARASADDPNDLLLIQVTDATSGGDVVRWSAVVRAAEVTFPA